MSRFVRSRKTREKLTQAAKRSPMRQWDLGPRKRPPEGECEVPYEAAPSDAAPWLHIPRMERTVRGS